MEFKRCFELDCMLEAEIICRCTFPETYSCILHIKKHIKSANKTHSLESIFADPCKGAKEAILLCITKEKSILKKRKALEFLNERLFHSEIYLRDKRSKILRKQNSPILEEEFRKTCQLYKNNLNIYNSPPLIQAYQDYTNTYCQNVSLYNIASRDLKTNLFIYNTESEKKEVKILENKEIIGTCTCIAQLPNGKLFCFDDRYNFKGYAVIIDRNGGAQRLPSGNPPEISSAMLRLFYIKILYVNG